MGKKQVIKKPACNQQGRAVIKKPVRKKPASQLLLPVCNSSGSVVMNSCRSLVMTHPTDAEVIIMTCQNCE